jgi:hypothetical protein
MASVIDDTAASTPRRSCRGDSTNVPSIAIDMDVIYEEYERREGRSNGLADHPRRPGNVFTCFEAMRKHPGVDMISCTKCINFGVAFRLKESTRRKYPTQDTAPRHYECDTLWKSVPKAVSSVSTPAATSPVPEIAQKQPTPIDSSTGKRKQLSSEELLSTM